MPDVDSMKTGEMKKELESYGVSTKSFLEKKEIKAALEKARKEGKKPKKRASKSSSKAKKEDKKEKSSSESKSREETIAEATEKAKAMKVGELKKTLQSMGVSTKSFFEKSEFVKAYAEAVADGAKAEEEYDPSYRDVAMQKMNAQDARLFRGALIDIKIK